MNVFDRTKSAAEQRGLTISQVEKQAQLKDRAIYAWKRSKPSGEAIAAVADVLHVSTDYLLGRTTKSAPVESKENKTVDMDEMLEDDELLMSFQGKEISKEYRDAILAILRTMPNLDENGKEV